jgi:kynurenine formamidase
VTIKAERSEPTLATVLELAQKYRAWGRWGPDDELGAANYVTPDKVQAAARLVRKGKVISLAMPLDSSGPQTGDFGRVNPIHVMLQDGGDVISGAQDHLPVLRYTDDAVFMPLQCATQWDALAHIFHEGKMYNGYGPEDVSSQGAKRNAVTGLNDRAVGRGVLLDIARAKGKPWLDQSEPISAADLLACCESEGVEVREGDFLLVRTGRLAYMRQQGSWGTEGEYTGGPAPGLALSTADVLCNWHIAAVASDTWGVEVRPNETPDVFQPLHIVVLVNAGIWIGEMFDLEALAADCAEDGVYEFMFVAPPLTITGAVGSPINPQAIK